MQTPVVWFLSFEIPYDTGWSKNRSHRTNNNRWFRTAESSKLMDSLIWEIKSKMNLKKIILPKVTKHLKPKIWVDLKVYRPDYKMDPHNIWDNVADAIKKAIGIDDRYFAIYRLDWELSQKPLIRIRIGF